LDQGEIQFTRMQAVLPGDGEFTTLLHAFALDTGEQETLALMYQQPAAILLTDDAAARLVAEQLGMCVHGTIGVLVRAVRRNQRTPVQVLSLLRQLPQRSTLYIRPGLLDKILAQVQSEFGLD
jgi:predicted nucleic acid-binding protein